MFNHGSYLSLAAPSVLTTPPGDRSYRLRRSSVYDVLTHFVPDLRLLAGKRYVDISAIAGASSGKTGIYSSLQIGL